MLEMELSGKRRGEDLRGGTVCDGYVMKNDMEIQ